MKIITCSSYYGCGSSAITDLISEYKSVTSLGDAEFRFLHDIDGISDLEYHLIECPNRHNSGHALKRFMRLSEFNAGTCYYNRYEKFFDGQYMTLTYDYFNKLKAYQFTGKWFYDYYDRYGTNMYYLIQLVNKILNKLIFVKWRPLKNEQTYGTIMDEKKFLEYTQEYTHLLLEACNKSGADYLMIDQLMPSSNINRCLRYVKDDIFVFVVERDPRDLYIMGKYIWINERVIPSDDVETFCKWFRFTRGCAEGQAVDEKKVLKIHFEDLIYKYEETKQKIVSFVGLREKDHLLPFAYFNPQRSVVNTQSWKTYPQAEDAIRYIEQMLPEYIYDFDAIKNIIIPGVECTDKNHF